ncbi:MAG: MBL fold metallo-hydrolase [Polyangiaceae bacterium]|nr:MBL fold metallo-hydrolase [Polyangiaceae bacterium]
MGRFDARATVPARGALDMLRWKLVDRLAGRNRTDPGGFVTPRREPDHALLASRAASLCWIGHASFLFTLGGVRVLIDPVLGRLGPLGRLAPPGLTRATLPPVDLVLVTHNHRDHLDPCSIAALSKQAHEHAGAGLRDAPLRFVAPLGNTAALAEAGAEHVDELDWWQSLRVGPLEVTLVPARHWSMRRPWDRNDALWGGFVVRGPEGTVYHSGDTAMFDGFGAIRARLGPIDWALLPIGSYEPRWFMEPQHICPEEAVAAAGALGARRVVAMHWGTFKLTDEPVGEPPERARAAWRRAGRDEAALWVLDVGETRPLGA